VNIRDKRWRLLLVLPFFAAAVSLIYWRCLLYTSDAADE